MMNSPGTGGSMHAAGGVGPGEAWSWIAAAAYLQPEARRIWE
jgi:hypothetical protein